MVGIVTTSGRKPSRRARSLRAAVRAAGLEASEGSARQYGSSRQFLARTDSNSHASAPHKLMIQNHHLEHALSALSMHSTLQNPFVKLNIRTTRLVNLRAAGPAAALVHALTLAR
jgi:hypothetical protein